jgi:hypothetical protein
MTDADTTDSETNRASEHVADRDRDALGVDPVADVRIPDGAETFDCPHCGRVFARERHRDLHRGQEHPQEVVDEEVTAYREAAESEWAELRRYRYVALGTLVLLYFGFLITYAFVG